MLEIYNGRDKFYQWDVGQKLIVDDNIIAVQYDNGTGDALVCGVYEYEGKHVADVPNIMLQTYWAIKCYAYCGECVRAEKVYEVEKRSRPDDYIYTETETLRYTTLFDMLTDLEAKHNEDVAALENEIEINDRKRQEIVDIHIPNIYNDINENLDSINEINRDLDNINSKVMTNEGELQKLKQYTGESVDKIYGEMTEQEIIIYDNQTRIEELEKRPTGGGGGTASEVDWAENDETSPAYIKNRTHYEGWGTSVIMPETAPDYIGNEDGMMMAMYAKPLAAGLEVGKEYTVNYNGVAYKCVAIDGTTIESLGRVLGDVGLMTGGESTGEPFVFMCLNEAEAAEMNMGIMGILLDGAETLNLSITYEGMVIHKLDSKFIDVATPDWNATSNEKGYIANRTHYTENKGIYEVDKNNVEGLESFVMPNGTTAYKVYDKKLYHDELDQAVLTWFRDGSSNTPFIDYTYYSSYVLGEGSNGFGGLIQISSADVAETELGVENIPSEGIYLYNNSSEYNILRLFLNNIVYKLDSKYLDLSSYYNKYEVNNKLAALEARIAALEG